jgi:peptidoglycan/xylan/chitin deacetylase (PgdA/CDA1 family)
MNTAILTIDDVPSKNTPAIVNMLQEKGITAVLFATGQHLEQFQEEAAYAVTHGMIVGNHSYSHPAFSSLTPEEARREIDRCEALLDDLYRRCGVERLWRPFRFPYGDKGGKNASLLQQYLRQQGFHKLDDRHIPYAWWRENGLNQDIDTFWTFDFEEYRMHSDKTFTMENIRTKMDNRAPEKGTPLFANWAKLARIRRLDTPV